jgi:hypothetical protein
MNDRIQLEMVTIEEVIANSDGWRLDLRSSSDAGFHRLNARGVEFIAKPGRMQDLRNCIRAKVMDYLKLAHGFSSAVVLTSHKEPRLVLVLTFWQTEMQAKNNCWEHAPVVRKLVQPLIDVCSKVQTYEAAVPQPPGMEIREIEKRTC